MTLRTFRIVLALWVLTTIVLWAIAMGVFALVGSSSPDASPEGILVGVIFSGPSRFGYHRFATFGECMQRGSYRFLLHLVPLRERWGDRTLVHLALMHRYLGVIGHPEALDPAEALRQAPVRLAPDVPKARAVYEAYVEHYDREGDFGAEHVLAVEEEFEFKLGEHPYTQRPDMVVRWEGRCWIVDHKCIGRVTPRAVENLGMRGQMVGYAMVGPVIAARYGLPFGGVIGNLMTPAAPFEFRRVVLEPPPPAMVESFPRALHAVAERLSALKEADRWNYPRALECMTDFGLCEYYALCCRGKDALGEYVQAVDVGTELPEV